ncbi:MAG TPA: hypothetical protein DF614_05730 [Methylococcaceae bacterium]|nr:hypothetical protein [Methylococcaceae bacterium]
MNTTTQTQAANAFNQANAAYRSGDFALALSLTRHALEFDNQLEPAWLTQARCLVKQGDVMAAREAFAQTLRLNPQNYSAWLEAGHLCKQIGELKQAAMSYQRAIDTNPERYEAFLGMARVLDLLGETALSDHAYEQSINAAQNTAPQMLEKVHHLMGQYCLEKGDAARAMRSFQLALHSIPPEDVNAAAEIQMDCAIALLRLDHYDKALQLFSLASAATHESTLARLTSLSFRHNFWQEAIDVARRNVALHNTSPTAHWNLAHLLAECWQMHEAQSVLEHAERLAPMPGATSLRAAISGKTGDVDKTLDLYLSLARSEKDNMTYASSAAMSSLYSDKLSPQEVANLHRELFAPLGAQARSRDTFQREPLDNRRLRVGIVSADFHHQHPVNIFMQPMLRDIDQQRFEIFVYFTGDTHDTQTALVKSRVEHWIESGAMNDTQLTRRIENDAIDLLLDMAGHTSQHRMGVFANRAAPVQVTYLGYPGSTGVPNMDWILGDKVVTPEGCDSLYSEKIWRLPGTVFCFAPEENYPLPALSKKALKRPLTFGSFNNVPKLTPRTLALWARVLEAVPDSRLVIKAPSFSDDGAIKVFRERLAALNVDVTRVAFRGPVGLTDMMAEYGDIDIALDTLPYNGGTTSLQAMWMGVPVITMLGGHFVSRMGASFMTAAGLSSWIAKDDDDYVAIAIAQAKDRAALLALKKGLRAQLQKSPAWDITAHTRAFEQALWEMASEVLSPAARTVH